MCRLVWDGVFCGGLGCGERVGMRVHMCVSSRAHGDGACGLGHKGMHSHTFLA